MSATAARLSVCAALAVVPLSAIGCRGGGAIPSYAVAIGGDPARGQAQVEVRHCGACHRIPDVTGAAGVVGPSLAGFARRSFIAGELPNTPENLVPWIRDPHALERGTAMPALGLDEGQARDVAAFLYTLDGED
jgi:cytochrome c2